MAKIRWLTALAQRKEFFLRAGTTFVFTLGILSAAIGITGYRPPIWIIAGVVIAILALAIFLQYEHWRVPQVSVEAVLPSEIAAGFYATAHCPCDRGLAMEAGRLAQKCFASTFTIPSPLYEQLRAKNPNILVCLTDNNGAFLGYLDAIPVKESFALPFLQGTITEEQITHDDVLAPAEARSCKYLFIAGLAVWHPETPAGRRSASILAWAALRFLERFYAASQPNTFAVASTGTGEALLKRFDLGIQCPASGRRDHYNLYSVRLTADEIRRRLAYLPDWSGLCRLTWAKATTAPPNGRRVHSRLPKTKARDRVSQRPIAGLK
jgi:hypothetical protein